MQAAMRSIEPGPERAPSSAPRTPCLALEASGLTRTYGSTVALWRVDLHAEAGAILLVQGPNGCGKSTLLRMLAGLTTPTAGTIRWRDPSRPSVSHVGHASGLYAALTPFEHLALSARLAGTDLGDGLECLERLGATSLMGRPCGSLSAGMARRVSLARAFSSGSQALLIDEPLAALDESAAGAVLELLAEAAAGGRLVIVTAPSDPRLRAVARRQLALSGGRVLAPLERPPIGLDDAR